MSRNKAWFWLIVTGLLLSGCNKSQPGREASQSAAGEQSKQVVIDPATAGTIKGTALFKGEPPKFRDIDMGEDPSCPQKPIQPDVVVVNKGKLANVFVYVKEGLPSGSFAAPSTPVVLDQKGCRYQPHMLGVMVGQPLQIANDDPSDHNIHSMSQQNANFNISQLAKDPPVTQKFDHPEMMIPLECNQHQWMRAYLNVMTHPFFAVSAEDGSFEIQGLPPGEYTIAAVHEKFGEQTAKVKVEPRETRTATFTFESSR